MKRAFSRSAAGGLLQAFRVAITFDLDLRGGAVDLAQIVRRQLDVGGADVLFEPVHLRGARNRGDPQLLREQPRKLIDRLV